MNNFEFESAVIHELSNDLVQFLELKEELVDCAIDSQKKLLQAKIAELKGKLLENIAHLKEDGLNTLEKGLIE